jgi:outer membrane immunogenic protein
MINLRSGILGLTLTSAIVLAASSANAADMYRREAAVGGYKDGPVYAVNTWTGFYAGVNGGYAWEANDDRYTDFKREGGFGGGQIGYNFGSMNIFGPQFVFGIEADFQGADINDRFGFTLGGLDGSYKSQIDWFGTVRGRIGYAMDRTLIYATGGFAYANVEDTLRIGDGRAKNDETLTGWVVGGGIEHKFTPNWSIKAEYQYINLDNDGVTLGSNRYGDGDLEFHTARVGLNYHFGSTYESLK